jgi:ATPase family associated with various cellular activities (AAA)
MSVEPPAGDKPLPESAAAEAEVESEVEPAAPAPAESTTPAWARWVRLAARIRVQEVRAGWREREAEQPGARATVHAEIDAILRDTPFTPRRGPGAQAIAQAGRLAVAEPRFARIVVDYELSLRETQWLALLALCQADPRWSRVLGYLEDDLRPMAPTPSTAAMVWGWAPGEASTLGPDCALVRCDLAAPVAASGPPTWTPDTPWAVAPRLVAYLCGQADESAVRRTIGSAASALLTPLPCRYTWDDLVVAEGVRSRLREIEARVRLRAEVLEDWDLGRLSPGNHGLTVLFAGPSGTGKTMAAQVLAGSLGLELYRADLAEVVDKYIGETEKRLARIFDECERHRVVLLFDEADALFGQRTRVRDAHDRFANIEIDYLLQRLETFSGTAILSTNRKADLDQAFLRRLAVVVDFLTPAPDERLRLWRIALPERTAAGAPLTEGIDARRLAEDLDLTGAEIKSVVLSAAYLARSRGELIGMGHVWEAARIELAKRGNVLRINGMHRPGAMTATTAATVMANGTGAS